MTTQNNLIKKPTFSEINLDNASLGNVRDCLTATGFELLEIREFDDGKCDETWISPADGSKVRINITLPVTPLEEEKDTSRTELVSEVIDLWFELRSIRNLLSEESDDLFVQEEETPMERYFNSLEYYQNKREGSLDTWKFTYSKNIDESIMALYSLDETDRLAIIQ